MLIVSCRSGFWLGDAQKGEHREAEKRRIGLTGLSGARGDRVSTVAVPVMGGTMDAVRFSHVRLLGWCCPSGKSGKVDSCFLPYGLLPLFLKRTSRHGRYIGVQYPISCAASPLRLLSCRAGVFAAMVLILPQRPLKSIKKSIAFAFYLFAFWGHCGSINSFFPPLRMRRLVLFFSCFLRLIG